MLENGALVNIAIRNCDLHADSGKYPRPFADRMNQLEDFAHGSPQYPDTNGAHWSYLVDARRA